MHVYIFMQISKSGSKSSKYAYSLQDKPQFLRNMGGDGLPSGDWMAAPTRMHRHRCGTSAREVQPRRQCVQNPTVARPQHGHAPQDNMARTSRWSGGPVRVLTYALLAQLSLVDAQVAEIEKASNDSLLWGPYRPNLYFGVRPRIPKSLMGGLLWTKVEDHTVQHSKSIFFPQLAIPDKMHYG
jgi:hypothetical protein